MFYWKGQWRLSLIIVLQIYASHYVCCQYLLFYCDGYAFVDKNIKSYDPKTHSFYDIKQIARSAYKWVLTNWISIKRTKHDLYYPFNGE